MKVRTGLLFGLIALSTGIAQEAWAADTDWEILTRDAEVKYSFRYRYEGVDDDRFRKDAEASTLRSRLSFSSGRLEGFQFFIEAEDISEIVVDNYNAGAGNTPERTQYPVVADPRGTDLNQVYIDYKNGSWNARAGRQRINFDNQRFIGGVLWRQNEQTFDALKIDYSTEQYKVQYAYINEVKRIFGDEVDGGEHDQDGTHILNVGGSIDNVGKVTGYYYLIDNEDAIAFSTATYGVRLSGKRELAKAADENDTMALRYTVEYAHQSDAGDNPVSYSANYWNLDGGVILGRWDLGLGWEVLGGDADKPGAAFRTPLGTNHAFNGWADLFLSTPDAGLDDRYLKVKFVQGKAVAQLRYHLFEAEDGGADFGDELDLSFGYKINDWLRADAKYARFEGDRGIADVSKFWLMMTANF
jgi:hypothetical protein